ncbi:hypothetical protein PV08_00768 [Exophiala spinifera]|uniref:Chitin-binding type-3 domain-containing protein n=1 Tax=Exophiala spinifera TaxID=91928 RepID=A0A0D2BMN0_9EURO|nr:uncharacterized protein PV08_00768 [Exophiala spinifera]KIW20193.1 hypothetical protein PV08_00768 [Exophiala spinifera]
MWLLKVLLFLIMVNFGAMTEIPMCGSQSSSSQTSHGCTMTYTPYMAPQIGPTSTVYGAIMTTYFYVVDCHYCTVTNHEQNPAPQGPFTTKTTSSMLTVTRVECMPETTAITRRAYRGYEEVEQAHTRTASTNKLTGGGLTHHLRRSSSAVTGALLELATTISNNSPDIRLLTGPSQESLTEIMSALFALNVADSGMNLTSACQQVTTTEVSYRLLESDFNPDQVKGLICWISANGYSFNSTRAAIISALQAAIYGLEVTDAFTSNRTEICGHLDLFNSIGGFLGINTKQYQDIVCGGISSETTTPTPYPRPQSLPTVGPSASTGSPWASANSSLTGGNATKWELTSTSWNSSGTAFATGNPLASTGAPWVSGNATTWESPSWNFSVTAFATGNPVASTGCSWVSGNSSFVVENVTTWGPPISYTGSVMSWPVNWTEPSATMGSVVASSTLVALNETELRARTPPSPTAKPFYPAVSTRTRHSVFKRY